MKVFVCCEGVTDVGSITIFIQKCSANPLVEVECETHTSIRSRKIYAKKLIKYLSPDPDKFNRIAYIKKLYALAVLDNSNYIAYHQDAGHQGFKFVYDGIKKDFDEVIPDSEMHCLSIVPREMIESWLLADEEAYPSIPSAPRLPSKPEELWGKNTDLDSDYPYNYLVRVLAQFGLEDNRDTYTEIAEKSNVDTIRRKCPESFGQFYTDMQSFIPPEADILDLNRLERSGRRFPS